MSTVMVIGISGKIGAGKDTIANHLVTKYDFQIVRFADELKEEVLRILRKTCEEIWIKYELGAHPTEADLREMLWTIKPPIVRRLLQEWGTELRRHEYQDYWTKMWERKVESLTDQGVRVVTPDMRFLNEATSVRYAGGVLVNVIRPGLSDGDHVSETEQNDIIFDHVFVNDGTLEDLTRKVDAYLASR